MLIKSPEDIEALRGLTLSFITLGVRIAADLVTRQEKRSSELELLRQTSFLSSLSSGTETPRSENPTPVSEAGSVVITYTSEDVTTISPTPPEGPTVEVPTVKRVEVRG